MQFSQCISIYRLSEASKSKRNTVGPHTHAIHRRSASNPFDQVLNYNLAAPSVDWKNVIGSKDIGASFGVIMINFMALKVCKYILFVESLCLYVSSGRKNNWTSSLQNLSLEFVTRPYPYQFAQLQRLARKLKFCF